MGTYSILFLATHLEKTLREIGENSMANKSHALLTGTEKQEELFPKWCKACKHWQAITVTLGECHAPFNSALLAEANCTQGIVGCNKWKHYAESDE